VTSWANKDEAFANIAMGIRKAVGAFAARRQSDSSAGAKRQASRESNSSDAENRNGLPVQITFLKGDALSYRSDVLILKHAQALYGLDRTVAEMLATSADDFTRFDVPMGEHRLFNSERILGATSVLFVGVQPLIFFDYAAIERFADRSLEVLGTELPAVEEISLTLHGPGYGLDEREATLAMLRGLVSAIERGACPSRLRRIAVVERDEERLGVCRR
jgi:hypothetical protein